MVENEPARREFLVSDASGGLQHRIGTCSNSTWARCGHDDRSQLPIRPLPGSMPTEPARPHAFVSRGPGQRIDLPLEREPWSGSSGGRERRRSGDLTLFRSDLHLFSRSCWTCQIIGKSSSKPKNETSRSSTLKNAVGAVLRVRMGTLWARNLTHSKYSELLTPPVGAHPSENLATIEAVVPTQRCS